MDIFGLGAGMIVGDALGALVAPATVVPATGAAATPKTVTAGKAGTTTSPRQSLYLSAFYVVGAVAVLLLGSRALKDARIG